MSKRIILSDYHHAEPGETKHHMHDVYTTWDLPEGADRIWVGQLTKAAVQDWRASWLLRRQALRAARRKSAA